MLSIHRLIRFLSSRALVHLLSASGESEINLIIPSGAVPVRISSTYTSNVQSSPPGYRVTASHVGDYCMNEIIQVVAHKWPETKAL
ncbi:hypothetical protein J3E69DRAFT_346743 [Trichoderma sp. SZMC 28015]